ncbi:MAG: PD-(D/E)XK nuclease domain-containing protein, partial [Deltaproteobacteria bacterium]|jgi:hypothetical protein|nr:PD-(D/E)XK nuclease domain-containing protein [Deltaproteobacteria bacterium]
LRGKYHLDYPNLEVRAALTPLLLGFDEPLENPLRQATQAKAALAAFLAKDASLFSETFGAVLADIPYNLHLSYEAYYQLVFCQTLVLAGQAVDLERPSGEGAPDAVVCHEATGEVFVVEIKYRQDKADLKRLLQKAMTRIEEKKYALKFRGAAKAIYKTALAVAGRTDVAIAFEEAPNWRLEESPAGHVVQRTGPSA